MGATSKSAEETRELIYLALQDHDDWTTTAQLSEELGIGRDTIKAHFRKIKQEHPNIISSKQFGYKIVTDRKNSEGYSDPTAKAAIDRVDAELAAKNGVVNESVPKKEYNRSFYGADYDDISKIEPETQPLTIDDADIVQLITERNLYKTFYEQLLEVMKA